MIENEIDILEEAVPLQNIGNGEIMNAIAKFKNLNGGGGLDERGQLNKDDDDKHAHVQQNSQEYRPKWSSSNIDRRTIQIDHDITQDDEHDNESLVSSSSFADSSFVDFDDLPDFADDECRELSRQIKMFERKRDNAAKSAKEHQDRVSLMKAHLNNVRQEIVYTNGLLAAKQKEISTERHFVALAEREKAAVKSEIRDADQAIKDEKEKIRSIQNQIYLTNEELEKLKLSLNWNQEELEQWATAAAKKESDHLALEKFQRADEVKIKDLTLKLENLTKLSVEKQAELENEKTETQSKQLEVDRLTKLFKVNHDERRQLVDQWQKTLNAMKERDEEINNVSSKYRKITETLSIQQRDIAAKREDIFDIKGQIEEFNKEVEGSNRLAQNKRQEKINEDEILLSLQLEVDALKAESIASSKSLQSAKTKSELSAREVSEKSKQLELLQYRVADIKNQLESEKGEKLSKEKISQNIEDRLKDREKEMKKAESRTEKLRQKLFQESQHMTKLRQKESNLINEIKSTQSTVKNLNSRLKDLERERTNQQEILYNADFKLQQVERKVARGLGERSYEEKDKLMARIRELEEEQNTKRGRNKHLKQQYKILQQEVKKWSRKNELCTSNKRDVQRQIDEVELEIVSCELNLQKLRTDKEEDMVSLDLVRLEVRRLRDILNHKTGEVYTLEDIGDALIEEVKEKKHVINLETEVRTAQLRAAEEERHRCKIELGQRSIAAEKIQMKYEMITKAHNTGSENEDGGNSHVYSLIAAAQKRADLQSEGDQLDNEISKKQKEMKAMEKTLAHLKGRNTDFRQSFAKIDCEGPEFKEIMKLGDNLKFSEKEFFEAKKVLYDMQRAHVSARRDLKIIESKRCEIASENEELDIKKRSISRDIDDLEEKISAATIRIEEERIIHKTKYYPHIRFNSNELSTQELSFVADLKEMHLSHNVKMMMELGVEFPEIKNSIIASLTNEGIEIQRSLF